jgi:hypothetical protein
VKGKQECSFLKKRTKKLLFLRKHTDTGHGPAAGAAAGNKSLLLLFFRKEGLAFS